MNSAAHTPRSFPRTIRLTASVVNMTMSADWLDPYLARLGMAEPGKPSLEALTALHRAHVERVPYENIDIQLGRPPGIDPEESIRRIIAGRGGYCYNVNGAFSTLLTALGYRVTRHRGGVHGEAVVPRLDQYGNHMALTVDLDGETWMVDVGLANAHHEPMRLVEGEHRQGPFVFGLERIDISSIDAPLIGTAQADIATTDDITSNSDERWRFVQDAALSTSSFSAMDFSLAPVQWTDFLAHHAELSTAPTSSFVRALQIRRRDERGIDYIVGSVLHRIEGSETVTEDTERELTTADEWFEAATDVFGLNLAPISDEDRKRLWKRLRVAHEQWLATQAAAAQAVAPQAAAVEPEAARP